MYFNYFCPACDIINFEINLSLLIKLVFYITKKSRQKCKYLKNKRTCTSLCSYHVMYVFQSESTFYSCLNVKELLAQNRCDIWSLCDCNRTQDLVKWLSVHFWTKWLWVRVLLQSLKRTCLIPKSGSLRISFLKNFSLKSWTLVLVFFLQHIPDVVYRKIATALFPYLAMFKLNLKQDPCCSILGPATNQKRFGYIFEWLSCVMFWGSIEQSF